MLAFSRLSRMLVAAFAAASIPTAAPAIFNTAISAKPGDFVSVQGANFGVTPVVWLDSTVAPSVPLTTINKIGDWVAVQVPVGASGGLSIRIQNGLKSSTPTKINAARVHNLDALQVVPGGKARLLGRNLLVQGYTPVVMFDGFAATVDTLNSNEHMLSVTVPTGVSSTAASVITVDNGNGTGPYTVTRTIPVVTGASGDYFSLGVSWAACFTTASAVIIDTTTDSRMSVKVVADGTTDNSAALQRAFQIAQGLSTGAIVQLPAGNVRLASGVELGSKVILRGAGKAQTTISYSATSFPIFGGGLDSIGVCELTFQPTSSAPESLYLHDCTRVFVKNVKFNQSGVHPAYLTNNRNLVVTGCDWPQTVLRDDAGVFSLGNSKGFVFTNNTTTVMSGGCAFPFTSDGYIADNHITRDASYTQTPSSVLHMLTIDFAARIAIVNNIFDVTNGSVSPVHNDGETILTEGGGNARTENLGSVQSASSTTIVDLTNTFNTDPLGTGSIPENYGVAIVAGKGMGQTRRIVSISGGTITVDTPWVVVPDTTSKYVTMVWGLEKSLIKGNTLNGNPRGIILYQTAIREVDILSNTLTQNGGIYLRSYQKLDEKLFMPMFNVKIKGNSNANNNGLFPANVGAAFFNHDGKDFGLAMVGIDIQNNSLKSSNPNTNSNLYDAAGTDGFFNHMQTETSYYETPNTPRILGTLFQGNTIDTISRAYRLGTGANGTVIAGTVEVTVPTTFIQNDQTSGSTEVATNTVVI